ncbi:FAD-dependent oxidoreductase [Mycobacteroides stephanolepidis]|uniref:FAD-dependent oxidoreductase n=1 Tax=[Mycobacterium] stephanolepidis TaxID=1520670 RepID=A0A1Z4F0B6_9MYCO|nr:FAD-dependent oxidoreductase [[Mycobacterium] stephanolepidis]BAX98649.1 FAD-dependent oxidoreductase [[Mycobacterium] stephanolepidis]
MDKFDVAIVGARCAGASLAIQLARQGLSVCLLDKARFPADKASTHLFTPSGTAVLERLGVLDDVVDAGAMPLRTVRLRSNDVAVATRPDPAVIGVMLGIRRETFDLILVEHAARAGVEIRTGCLVDGVLTDRGRVVGVETRGGSVYANLVVGADGQHSRMAEYVGAQEYLTTPGSYMPTWSFYEGATPPYDLVMGRVGEGNGIALPLDNGIYIAMMGTPMAKADAFLADRYANFDAALARWPEMAEAVTGATRRGPLRILRHWHGYFRTAAGPGWVLVGDAGRFKDPAPGQGMADAFRQSESLAARIAVGLGGGTIDDELRSWWQWRDADALEMYWAAATLGELTNPPAITDSAFRALGKSDAAVERVLEAILPRTVKPHGAVRLRDASRLAAYVAAAVVRHPSQLAPTIKAARWQVRQITRLALAHPGHWLGARRYRELPVLPPRRGVPDVFEPEFSVPEAG